MGWKKWFPYNTSLEKKLIVFIAILCVVVLVLFICMLSSARAPGACNNPECIRAATYILDTIDPTIDPCDDFYNFACGTFLKKAFSLGQPNTLYHLKDLMKNKLKEIVMETTNERDTSRMLKMQRKFYKACINEKDIEEDNNKAFFKLLDELVGGWPVVKTYNWVENDFDWTKTMIKARKMGFFYEFYFKVDIYMNDNDSYSLWIKPPSIESISSFNWEDRNINIIAEIASDMGAQSVETATRLRSTMYFVDRLKQIIQKHDNDPKIESEIERTAIKNLEHKYIKMHWLSMLRNITGLPLKPDTLVIFDVENYFRDLYYLLMKTPKRIQANYMAWAVISTNIDYLTRNIREKYKKMKNCENNTKTDLSRSENCYKISTGLFQYVAESEYIRKNTSPEKRKHITEIINNVKQQLEVALEKNSWMDTKTKDDTIRHLKTIKGAIGWTDIVYSSEKFEGLFGYRQVKITSKLIDMARTLALHGVNRYYNRLTYSPEDIVEDYFKSPHLEVNAYYSSYLKTIILLTPLLQGFIFHEDRPHYLSYGSLGSIIGHELTHGITEESIRGCGNDTRWTNKTHESFKNVAQCLIDEYDMYAEYITGFSKNGSNTLEENLADFTGINLAYTAYQEWVRQNHYEDHLPGIKFTPNQIFWISASNFLCHDPTVTVKEGRKKMEMHGVPKFRVNGRVRNSPYFAKDFNCPVGSKMNPENKCRVFT